MRTLVFKGGEKYCLIWYPQFLDFVLSGSLSLKIWWEELVAQACRMIMGSFVGRLISLLKNILSFYPEIVSGFWNSRANLFPSLSFLVRLSLLSLVREASSSSRAAVSFGLGPADLISQGFFFTSLKGAIVFLQKEAGLGHKALTLRDGTWSN